MRRSCDAKGAASSCRLRHSKIYTASGGVGTGSKGQPAKGVAMKRFACLLTALLGICLAASEARAPSRHTRINHVKVKERQQLACSKGQASCFCLYDRPYSYLTS